MNVNKIPCIKLNINSASRFKQENKKQNYFYFELRTGDCYKDTIICDRVIVNNEGSLETDRDILQDAIDFGIIPENERKYGVDMKELENMYEKLIWV